jgi:IS30 family transposase
VEVRLTVEQWSPVQITSETSISHERIYQHIAANRARAAKNCGGLYAAARNGSATVVARHDNVRAIEDKLNQRPRKRLGFRTPQQVFDASFNRGALRS